MNGMAMGMMGGTGGMGTMGIDPTTLGQGPLTREELDAWKAQEGRACATQDAMWRYAHVSMKLDRVLSKADLERYKVCILAERRDIETHDATPAMNAKLEEMARVEEKALGCSDVRAAKLERREQRKNLFKRHVRVNKSGATGRVGWRFQHASHQDADYEVTLESGEVVRTSYSDVTLLCEVCSKEAVKRCSVCEVVWYCGRKCQKQHWKAHKLKCAPPDKEAEAEAKAQAQANAVVAPPINLPRGIEGMDVARSIAQLIADGTNVPVGLRVVLRGLSAKGGEMNGKVGRVIGFADGRHVVQLDGPEGRKVKVKPGNVRPAPDRD